LFAYNGRVRIAGFHQQVDYVKLGPSLLIAGSLVLAIRTARWSRDVECTASQPEWDAEVEHSVRIAYRVLTHLVKKFPSLFNQMEVPRYEPDDDESPP